MVATSSSLFLIPPSRRPSFLHLHWHIFCSACALLIAAPRRLPMSHMFDILPKQPAEHLVRRLEKRQSYLAKAPYQQNKLKKKSKRKALNDLIMKLCPTTWVAPVVIQAHDRWEYDRDKKYVQEVHVQYQEKRKKDPMSTRNSIGKLVDIRPVALEIGPIEGNDSLVDPWKLPPIEDPIEHDPAFLQDENNASLDPHIQQYRPTSSLLGP